MRLDFSFSEEEPDAELVLVDERGVDESALLVFGFLEEPAFSSWPPSPSFGFVVEVKIPGTPEERDARRSPPGLPSPCCRLGDPVHA